MDGPARPRSAPTTAAIIIEPVQGEGGARAWPDADLQAHPRSSATRHGALLIFDEIQCGMGRTGKLFAYEWAGRRARHHVRRQGAGRRLPGRRLPGHHRGGQGHDRRARHGSTYGGNPLAMAVGVAAFDEMLTDDLLEHVREVAGYFGQQLEGLKDAIPT